MYEFLTYERKFDVEYFLDKRLLSIYPKPAFVLAWDMEDVLLSIWRIFANAAPP
jgi:hypothetical protein